MCVVLSHTCVCAFAQHKGQVQFQTILDDNSISDGQLRSILAAA